jgi:hypothetical protein
MLRFITSFMGAGKAEIPGHFSRPRPISPDIRMSRKPRSTPSCITKRRDAEKTESRRPSARRRSGRSRGSPRRGSRVCGGYGRARAGRALRSALNPGHLARHDEWIHTPIRPGSGQRIVPGMPFQVDIIPTPMRDGWALNCQDRIVFAAAALKAGHPGVVERIEARRNFVRDKLGIAIRDSILPLSSTPLCLPPFWLSARRLLARV